MNSSTFKQIFPEFASTSTVTIDFFLSVGNGLLSVDRWGEQLDYGLGLFVAHHLAIADVDSRAAAAGAPPGVGGGVTTAKSVDKVSVTYDGSLGTYEGAGFWNRTTYGIRFFQLARMVGAGGYQV